MLNQVQHDTIFHVKYIPLLLVSDFVAMITAIKSSDVGDNIFIAALKDCFAVIGLLSL